MKDITCVICPRSCHIQATKSGDTWCIEGNGCKRGVEFALNELVNPMRSLTTTIKTVFSDLPLLPVKTDRDIPLNLLLAAMKEINKALITQRVSLGEILIENILNTGVNVVSTSDMNL